MRHTTKLVAAVVGLALLAACTPDPAGSSPQVVEAVVARSNNLFVGSDVRVLGMRVGQVVGLEPHGREVLVRMAVQRDVPLPAGLGADIKPVSLLGERYVQLEPPYTHGPTHPDGEIIPLERTSVPAETDEVLASFERFLEGLDPDTIAQLVDVLAETIEGQGEGLNLLLDRGATTVRILADSSDDLMSTVSALAGLNTALATRDQQIGPLIENWSAVVRTLADEGDEIVAGVGNLRRLVTELRPLLDDHAEQLVGDLEILTTTAGTVERNLDRVAQMIHGSRLLFEGAGRAFDYENARLRLLNHGSDLPLAITDRLTNRLVGLCLRLGLPFCAEEVFWAEQIDAGEICFEGVTYCAPGQRTIGETLTGAIELLPDEAVAALAEEARAGQGPADDSAERPRLRERLPLPLPDPRVEPEASVQSRQGGGLLDRLARLIWGRR